MEYDFSGKVALITGGASGMGKLMSENLMAAGAKVILADIAPCAESENALYVKCDVRDYKQIENVVNEGLARFGQIDFMLHFAGGDGIRILNGVRDFATVDPAILEWEIDVNLRAQMMFDRAVIGHMMERKTGVIMHMGSVTGLRASAGSIGYATAKSGAMNGLTKSLARYAAPHGIRVFSVAPGPVLTREAMGKMKTLLGRAGDPQEIIDLILYLISDKGSFITGSNFVIDGGHACMGG